MPDWQWIHTPGHTEGHISLFREKDRVLLAADAFTTVKQLRDLNPSLVIPSHGRPMKGEELTRHLNMLVNHFDGIAKPEQGRFVERQ